MEKIRLLASVVVITVTVLPIPASAWNIPGHMLSAAITYQILQQENPPTIEKVKWCSPYNLSWQRQSVRVTAT
jgi:hypothetical protein